MIMNLYHTSLSETKSSDNVLSEFMSAFISRTRIIFHQIPLNKADCFEPPYNVWPRGEHLPGGNRSKIEIRIE